MKLPVKVRDVNEIASSFHGYCDSVEAFIAEISASESTIRFNGPTRHDDGRLAFAVLELAPTGGERTRIYTVGHEGGDENGEAE